MKWTTSKILGYIITFAGIGLTIYLKDKQVFLEACMYATILLGVKTVTTGLADVRNSGKEVKQ